MTYKLILLPRAEKQLRKIKERELIEAFRQCLKEIAVNPYRRSKAGKLQGVYGHGFIYRRTAYRVAYFINKEDQVIYVLGLGSHEGFWEEIKRYDR